MNFLTTKMPQLFISQVQCFYMRRGEHNGDGLLFSSLKPTVNYCQKEQLSFFIKRTILLKFFILLMQLT